MKVFALLALAFVAVCGQNIWPMPQSLKWGSTMLTVPGSFVFKTTSQSAILQKAIQKYMGLIFMHESWEASGVNGTALTSLMISVQSADETLQLETDESYTLIVPDDGSQASIKATTVYGAMHGLETFSQLIVYDFPTHMNQLNYAPWNINDFPRFSHRGLLLDTSRHFESVNVIKQVIDSMTYAKMNVLHWHVVDSQSFPFESDSEPDLWLGSWSPSERYTHQDMINIVQYAKESGVRVMIEFDIPGHAASWCTGYPDICPRPDCLEPLDPSVDATYDLLNNLFNEITGGAQGQGLIPENLFHLGGDEVDTTCWSTTPHIVDWMNQNNFTTDDAYMYIVEKAHDMVSSFGRYPVNWEEVFNHFGNKLDPRSVIHVWLDHATLAQVVAAGYRGILSNNDVWYLDHLSTTWQQFYLNEPCDGITDPAQQALVIGGEVCMWGETVDCSDLFNTVWPRAAAAAERLWSARSVSDTTKAQPRLMWFRCFLNSRDIGAAPVLNSEARQGPPGPGDCYAQ